MRVHLKDDHEPDNWDDLPADAKRLMEAILKDFAEQILGDASHWEELRSLVQNGFAVLSIDPDTNHVSLRSNVEDINFDHKLTAATFQ